MADDTTSTAADNAPNEGGFKKTLTVFDMVVYGLIFMVPIAPMSIYGGLFQTSNGMPALVYLIALGCMIFSVLSFGVMIRRFPSSGSIYTYAARGISKPAGFIAGWLMILQYLITPNVMFIMAAEALHQYVPEIPVFAWCLTFLLFVGVMSQLNIKAIMTVDRLALAAELIVLAIFVFFGVGFVMSHPTVSGFTATAAFNPSKFEIGAMMSAVSLGVLSFVGFGSVATLTSEAKNPRTGPSKAMLIMVLVLGALFVGMCYIATCIDPTGAVFKDNPTNGFFLVAQMAGGEWLGVLCAVTIALSLGLFTGLSAQTSVARILYVMGLSGALPKRFATMRASNSVPSFATYFSTAFSLATLFIMLPLGMDEMAKVSNFGALATYCILNVVVIWYVWHRQGEHRNVMRHLICPAIGAVVVLMILCSLGPIAIVTGVVWAAIGVVYYLVATKVFKKRMSFQ